MLRWLGILEVGARIDKLNKEKLLQRIFWYILPTVIAVIVVNRINESINLYLKDTIINIYMINLLYISILHFYVQKIFFRNLKRDVIIAFITDKASDYILLRLFMIFIKTYLPVLIGSVVAVGIFFEGSEKIYYICSLPTVIGVIIFNILAAVYGRCFINTAKRISVKVAGTIFFIYVMFLFVGVSVYLPIYIFSNLEVLLREHVVRRTIDLHPTALLFFILITVFIVVIWKYARESLNAKSRILILNRDVSLSYSTSKTTELLWEIYQRHSFNLISFEKEIFYKDGKEIIRENKYAVFSVKLIQILFYVFILFIHFSEDLASFETSASISKFVTFLIIAQLPSVAFMSNSFEKHLNIKNDFEVLQKFNLRFQKIDLIRAKTRVLSAVVFPKIHLIFFVLILSSVFQQHISLALIYMLSAIQVFFIKNTLVLWKVKSINGLNSKSGMIDSLNMIVFFVVLWSFGWVYLNTPTLETYLQGQFILIALTALTYVFHMTCNNLKRDVTEENAEN